jgi:hypothetical protein
MNIGEKIITSLRENGRTSTDSADNDNLSVRLRIEEWRVCRKSEKVMRIDQE